MKQSLIVLFFFLAGSMNLISQIGYGPAPYCLPQYSNRPCNQPNASNNSSNSINDFIDNFSTSGATGNISNMGSGCNAQTIASTSENYYFVACPAFLRVSPGQNITCTFKSGIIFYQGFSVFIDWNKNGVFAVPAEQVCAPPGTPAAATNTTAAFTVPASQAVGTYTMRVRCAYATAGPSIDPCSLFGFGETEDYRLVVGTGTVCTILPVDLISYSGLYRNGAAELAWTTATEKNSDHYIVERSYDNENFEEIETIEASGTSYSEKEYFVTDDKVKANSIVYYRLRQFDKGNVETLKEVLILYTNKTNIGFEVFPNPAADEISVAIPHTLYNQNYNVELLDMNGNSVYRSQSLLGDGLDPKINTSHLSKGQYIVRLSDDSGLLMKKVLIKQ
jgi:hypothetical protein